MKNTEQIAETVLKIRDAEQEKLMLRNRRIKRVTAGASSMLVFCAVILAVRSLNTSQGKIPTIDNNHVIDAETSTNSSTTGEDKIGTQRTDAERQTESNGSNQNGSPSYKNQDTNTNPTESTLRIATEESNTDTSVREPTENNISHTEQQTEDNGSENAIIPKWDERTIQTQFRELNLNGIIYSTKDHSIESYHIGNILGAVTMQGDDIYEDKLHSINAEVFSISDISSNCAVAVKFNGHDKYYVYTNRDYFPSTLGELVESLKLNDTISFGQLTPDDRTLVSDYDRSILTELLNEYRDCSTLFDYDGHIKLFSTSTNVDMLGISNKSFAVTKDGYITTNIMEQGYSYYIGEDKAKEIADRLGINNIERDTTPYTFDPQEEVFYEE